MRLDGFVGPSNQTRSPNVDTERSVNLYTEIVDGGKGKVGANLYSTPGVRPYGEALGGGPVRALFGQDGRAFAVSGIGVWELFASTKNVFRGEVISDGNPATISTNGPAGHQLFITSGGRGYIFDLISDTLSPFIAEEGFPVPVLMGGFGDGYFLALKSLSNEFHVSALENGLVWDAVSVAQVSESSNQILAMIIDHRELWLFGSRTTEVWYNSGNADFPYQPVSGTFIEGGIIAPWSAAKLDNTVLWIGGDERGSGVVWRADGYIPKRISTHAVESVLQELPLMSDAIAWTYQQQGHAFYVLYLPHAETTWVYDVATNQWHERGIWDTNLIRWTPHIGRCHTFIFGHHLIGDRQSGQIYSMSLDLHTDQIARGL